MKIDIKYEKRIVLNKRKFYNDLIKMIENWREIWKRKKTVEKCGKNCSNLMENHNKMLKSGWKFSQET